MRGRIVRLSLQLLLSALLLLTACSGAEVRPSHPCGDDRDTALLAGRGESAFGAANFELATRCYERVLELDASDVEARMRLADLHIGWARNLSTSGQHDAVQPHHLAAVQLLEPLVTQPDAVDQARRLELLEAYLQASIAAGRLDATRTVLMQRFERADIGADEREALILALDELQLARLGPARDTVVARLDTAGAELAPFLLFAEQPSEPIDTPEERARVDQTIADLEQLLAEHPNVWRGYWLIGKAYEALAEHFLAVEWFAKAYATNPNHPSTTYAYVSNLVFLRQHDRALTIANEAAARFPHDAHVLTNQARVLYELCRLPEARAAAERARAIDPSTPNNSQILKLIADVESGQRECPR